MWSVALATLHERCGLDFHRHVSQHVGHHGPFGQTGAECVPGGSVVECQGQHLSHQARRADREVQTREV